MNVQLLHEKTFAQRQRLLIARRSNYHLYNYLGNSNDSSNNGSDTVDEKDLCVKNSVTCSVADEVCDSTDGMCKCGIKIF